MTQQALVGRLHEGAPVVWLSINKCRASAMGTLSEKIRNIVRQSDTEAVLVAVSMAVMLPLSLPIGWTQEPGDGARASPPW